jgi:predicted transcriptional regulator
MMLSRSTSKIAFLARQSVAPRAFTTVAEAVRTADDALKYSGYSSIDFTISEDLKVFDAVQRFAAFNIGCLVTTDKSGRFSSIA